MIVSLLTATSFSKKADNITIAALLHAVSWIAQFVGHGFAEKRAPALLDNLIGGLFSLTPNINLISSCPYSPSSNAAVVLAPFFVHLEVLFMLGYWPELHKQLTNDVGKELARIRKIEGDKKRAKAL